MSIEVNNEEIGKVVFLVEEEEEKLEDAVSLFGYTLPLMGAGI